MKSNKFFTVARLAGIRTTAPTFERSGTGTEFGLGAVTGQRALSEGEVVSRLRASKDPNHQAFLAAYYTSQFNR